MCRNDTVKNIRYELLQNVKQIMSDPAISLHYVKELLSARKYLSFKQEVVRQINDIPFPEDFSYTDVREMLNLIAKNYLFDLEEELKTEADSRPDAAEKLKLCREVIEDIGKNISMDGKDAEYDR